MNFAEGELIHNNNGHRMFVELAETMNLGRVFIWNVCTNLRCKEREDV